MKTLSLKSSQTILIDDDDYEQFKNYKWFLTNGYPTTNTGGYSNKIQNKNKLHRMICKAKKGEFVDHINGNKLDNRKCNLRLCSRSQNLSNAKIHKNNTSGYKGVSLIKSTGQWQATITVNKKKIYLGIFWDKKEAAKEYDKAATKYFKEFAKTNALGNLCQH